MTTKTKDQVQFESLNAVMGLQVAGTSVSMGMGKTRIGLKDMQREIDQDVSGFITREDRFLVAVPGTAIKQSWVDEAHAMGVAHLLSSIDFVTYLSLPKSAHGYKKVYLDECHSLKNKHYGWLYEHVQFHGGKVLGLTGTKPRFVNSESGKLVQQFCPMVYEYITDEAITDGLLNDYKIIVHRIPLSRERDFKIDYKKSDGTPASFTVSEIDNYDYWTNKLASARMPKETEMLRLQRMSAMKKWRGKEKYMAFLRDQSEDKTLLFTNTKEQAIRQCAHQYYSGNPQNKANLELFKKGEIVRLACVQQLNQGVNIAGLKRGIIWHSYGNEKQAAQKIGRFLRLNPSERATVHILMYANTVDENWVEGALRDFDQSKVIYIDSLIH